MATPNEMPHGGSGPIQGHSNLNLPGCLKFYLGRLFITLHLFFTSWIQSSPRRAGYKTCHILQIHDDYTSFVLGPIKYIIKPLTHSSSCQDNTHRSWKNHCQIHILPFHTHWQAVSSKQLHVLSQ
jgi:hypothetical protein